MIMEVVNCLRDFGIGISHTQITIDLCGIVKIFFRVYC